MKGGMGEGKQEEREIGRRAGGVGSGPTPTFAALRPPLRRRGTSGDETSVNCVRSDLTTAKPISPPPEGCPQGGVGPQHRQATALSYSSVDKNLSEHQNPSAAKLTGSHAIPQPRDSSHSSASRQYQVVALPGEGIGPEVVEASLQILNAIAAQANFTLTIDHALIGAPAQTATGSALPPETLACCEEADGIVFGAVTQSGLLPLRQHFDFFANLRPVRPSKSLYTASPINPELLEGVDLLFVRELVSGIYFGESGRGQNKQGEYGFHTMRYSDRDIRRIARVALAQAQKRQQHLVVAHKENALPHLPWRSLVQEEAQNFPQVRVEPMLVDNLAMQLILRPQEFDVILAGNLFGDILSDLGGAIAGSIGLLGSASLNASGFGLYESISGTAPDIAGKGIANPLGTLAGIILMLQQWGEQPAADLLLHIQEQILAEGYRTADLYQPGASSQRQVTTNELVQLFLTEIYKTPLYPNSHRP